MFDRFVHWESRLSPLQIVLIYAALSSIWILVSDKFLAWLVTGAELRVTVGIYKGWFFVAVSSALLYGLISRLTHRIRQSEAQLAHADRLASVGTMAASIAHEVNNPLTTIKVLIETLRDRVKDSETDRRDLDVVHDEIDKLRALILRFLQFARPGEPRLGETRLDDVTRRVVKLVRPQAHSRHVEIAEAYQAVGHEVWADSSQLGQVVLNVLLNAVEAAPEGGQVEARTTNAKDGSVTLRIWNSGSSLDPELRQTIFEPFYTTKASGTGLGLPIASAIVAKHHGRIWAEAGSEGGTAVFIQIPNTTQGESHASRAGR